MNRSRTRVLDDAIEAVRYMPRILCIIAVKAELEEKGHRDIKQEAFAKIIGVDTCNLQTWTWRFSAEGIEGLRACGVRGASRPCPTRTWTRQSRRPSRGRLPDVSRCRGRQVRGMQGSPRPVPAHPAAAQTDIGRSRVARSCWKRSCSS